ncbi:MAG: soxC 1 [Panacagrimonas sp.]|nr:soxC 1 [Panacagrimonas sp.]
MIRGRIICGRTAFIVPTMATPAAGPERDPGAAGAPARTDFAGALREIASGAAQREAHDENPFAAIEIVRAARIGALRLPVRDGGAGHSMRQFFGAIIDLAAADPVVAHILRTHYWFVEERLREPESARRTHWIGEIAAGRIFGNATTEHGPAALGALRYQTVLTPEGEDFSLTGTKFYCTGTLFSDYVNVWASGGPEKLVSLVVPTKRHGITLIDDWDGMGARKTGSGTTKFDRVLVRPEEILLEARLDAQPPPTYEFAFLQLYLQAIMAGILRNVVADAVKLVKSRERSFAFAPAEKPADDPLLQEVIGELSAAAFAAEATVLHAAEALDAAHASLRNGIPEEALAQKASLAAAQAKVHVDRVAARASDQLFDVGGASAASKSKNLDRHWRAIRTLTMHNPTLYKAMVVGKHLVHGDPLPINGYF